MPTVKDVTLEVLRVKREDPKFEDAFKFFKVRFGRFLLCPSTEDAFDTVDAIDGTDSLFLCTSQDQGLRHSSGSRSSIPTADLISYEMIGNSCLMLRSRRAHLAFQPLTWEKSATT